MGKTIGSLKKEALEVCKIRGHDMNKFTNSGNSATSFCRKCGGYVDVTLKPLPNGISIGGSALGRDCFKSSLHKGVIRDIGLRSSVGRTQGVGTGPRDAGRKERTPRSDIKKTYKRVWAGVKTKKTTFKKTIKGAGKGAKLEKWQCKKGGAHYWKIPIAKPLQPDGTPRTTVGKCAKCKTKRTFYL
jgi:hypothetical protein